MAEEGECPGTPFGETLPAYLSCALITCFQNLWLYSVAMRSLCADAE